MSVATILRRRLRCDLCGTASFGLDGEVSVRELRQSAKVAGWRYLRTGQDRCGRCAGVTS